MLLNDYIIPPFILNKDSKDKKSILNTNRFNLKYEEPIHNFIFIKKLNINFVESNKLNKTLTKKRQKKNKTEKNN